MKKIIAFTVRDTLIETIELKHYGALSDDADKVRLENHSTKRSNCKNFHQ